LLLERDFVPCLFFAGESVVSGKKESSKLTFEISTLVTATKGSSGTVLWCEKAAEISSDESKASPKLLLRLFDSFLDGSAETRHEAGSKPKLFCGTISIGDSWLLLVLNKGFLI
jgi:hypothetical protein